MDFEHQNIDQKAGFLNENKEDFLRSKTSLRMHYEAQVNVIKKQIGGLEEMRAQLGLSQRKMAQLLMVDPSAWTRWTKGSDRNEAPPHIWRALQWYFIIQEKIPGLTPQYFAVENPKTLHIQAMQKISSASQRIENLQAGLVDKEEELASMQDDLVETKKLVSLLEKKIGFQTKILVILLMMLLGLVSYFILKMGLIHIS